MKTRNLLILTTALVLTPVATLAIMGLETILYLILAIPLALLAAHQILNTATHHLCKKHQGRCLECKFTWICSDNPYMEKVKK